MDTWKRRGDDLLYSMIPKTVADRLRAGNSSLSTCEVIHSKHLLSRNVKFVSILQAFDSVTIMFCDLVGFNSSTVQDAMDVVSSMNEVFSCFDALMDKFNVYKVIAWIPSDNNMKWFFYNFRSKLWAKFTWWQVERPRERKITHRALSMYLCAWWTKWKNCECRPEEKSTSESVNRFVVAPIRQHLCVLKTIRYSFWRNGCWNCWNKSSTILLLRRHC